MRRFGVLILAVLLAGCAGTSSGSPKSTSPGGATGAAPAASASADQGSITGTVVTEELSPLPGTRVAVLEGNLPAQITDAEGAFTINGVPPGTVTVVADKLGYESKGQKVTATAGEIVKVRLVLTSIAVSSTPRVVTSPHDGFVEAAVVVPQYGVVQTNATGATKNLIVVKVDPDIQTSIHTLKWDSSAPGTGRFVRFSVCVGKGSCNTQTSPGNITRGFSPLMLSQDNLKETVDGKKGYTVIGQFYPTTCQAVSNDLCVQNPDTIAGIYVQQRYKYYVTLYYGVPAPPGTVPALP